MTFRDSVASAIGADPEAPDSVLLALLLRSLRKPGEVACPACGRSAAKNGKNAAGGHRYRCWNCKNVFILGGPGKGRTLPAGTVVEVVRLVDEGSSIRRACRIVGIAPSTGRKAVKRVTEIRHAQIMGGNTDAREPNLRG